MLDGLRVEHARLIHGSNRIDGISHGERNYAMALRRRCRIQLHEFARPRLDGEP